MAAIIFPLGLVWGQEEGLSEQKPDEHVLFAFKKSPPQLDGKVGGDPAWADTQAAEGFLVVGTDQAAENQTSVRAIWDEKALYLGVEAKLTEEEKPSAGSAAPWDNEGVEVWIGIGKGEKLWTQLIVDAMGRVSAFNYSGGTQTAVEEACRAVTNPGKGRWSAEVEIPFEMIGMSPPENGDAVGFVVHRVDKAGNKTRLSSWSRTNGFNQTVNFPELIFSSDWEISPQLSYWNERREKESLLRRQRVDAHKILASKDATEPTYTLWKYDALSIPAERRARHARLETFGLLGDSVYWSGYKDLANVAPDFERAAMGINAAMVELAELQNLDNQIQKARFASKDRVLQMNSGPSAPLAELKQWLDRLYHRYGNAFDRDWNASLLGNIDTDLEELLAEIRTLQQQTLGGIGQLQQDLARTTPWEQPDLRFAEQDVSRDPSGTPNRLHHTLYGAFPYQSVIRILSDRWDAVNVDWDRLVPESPSRGLYTFPALKRYADFVDKMSPGTKVSYHMLFGSYYAMPYHAWLASLASEDSDILITSQDGLQTAPRMAGGAPSPIHDGMNINHPTVKSYVRESVGALAEQFGSRTAYVVAGWEDNNILHLPDTRVAKGYRTVGYNSSGRAAFRDYLRNRYESIQELNKRWRTVYPSFEKIEPPPDKWLEQPQEVSGLTYEWERFIRWNHLEYSRLLRDAYKAGSPQTPVMIDNSHFLADGNLYPAFRHEAFDIISYHWTPANEDAIWTLIDRLATRFGKTMGYYENYSPMYTNRAAGNEEHAFAAISEFFWRLYVRGNRYAAWWIKGHTGSSDYAAAYGGGYFGLDFDQTILRWPTAILPIMLERGRQIEKALVNTKTLPTRAALLQPDASVINLSARTMRVHVGLPPITGYINLHNTLLAPGGYVLDFITEEMVMDGAAGLDEFETLIVINGFWMDPEFASQLKAWVMRGGEILAIGPCAISDPWGGQLTKETSPFLAAFPEAKVTGSDLWSVALPPGRDTDLIHIRDLGKGRITFITQPADQILRNAADRKKLENVFQQTIPRPVVSDNEDIKVATRVGTDGTLFLFPVNTSLQNPARAGLTVKGMFASAIDAVIPGGLPMAAHSSDGFTRLEVKLAPGDWTVIQLQAEVRPES